MNRRDTEQSNAEREALMPVPDMREVIYRLTGLLEEEVALLEQMQVAQAGALQAEKLALTQVLEAQKRLLVNQPDLLDDASDDERNALRDALDDFNRTLQRNVRLVAVAKAVNQRVVQSVLDALAEQRSTGAYTRAGTSYAPPADGLSISLNQKI